MEVPEVKFNKPLLYKFCRMESDGAKLRILGQMLLRSHIRKKMFTNYHQSEQWSFRLQNTENE